METTGRGRASHGRFLVGSVLLVSVVVFSLTLLAASTVGDALDYQPNHCPEAPAISGGSANTRIYITGLNTLSQAQGSDLVVQGYVEVANNISLLWEPTGGVEVALMMNGSYIYSGGLVDAVTNGTGNYSVVYTIPFNHTIGPWTLTIGLSPIPGYNYTHNPGFTPVIDVNITANTVIQVTSMTPAAFWNNDPFTVNGELTTAGGAPVPNRLVTATFGPSSFNGLTSSSGAFSIPVSSLNASLNGTLQFTTAGYYHGASYALNVTYLENCNHTFLGDVLTINSTNPRHLNLNVYFQGRFTYDDAVLGAGNVAFKALSLYWVDNNSVLRSIANLTTDSQGRYTFTYRIPLNEYVDEALFYATQFPTGVRVRAVLDTVTPIVFEQVFYIRPQVRTTVSANLGPAWKDEFVSITGELREYEPWSQKKLAGAVLNVSLWDGSTCLTSQFFTTNSTGGYTAVFAPQGLDSLKYTVEFTMAGMLSNCSASGDVPLFKNATFKFDPGMKYSEFAGKNISVFGTCTATWQGTDVKPVPNRPFNVYWDGGFLFSRMLGNDGTFSFGISTVVTLPSDNYTITLELADFNETGYDVSSDRLIVILELLVLNITLHPSIDWAIFSHAPLIVEGQITPVLANVKVGVTLRYSTSETVSITGDGVTLFVTDASGRFKFTVDGTFTATTLSNLSVVANYDFLYNYRQAISTHVVRFISSVTFVNATISGVLVSEQPSLVAGSRMLLRAVALSNHGTPVREYPVTVEVTGGPESIVATNELGVFTVELYIDGTPGQMFRFSILILNGSTVVSTSGIISLSIIPPPNYSWVLWFVPPAIIILVILSILYQKAVAKRQMQLTRQRAKQRMNLVAELVHQGKFREAIAYCHHVLEEVIQRKYGIETKESRTIRELADILVKEKDVPPELVFGFMKLVQEGLYSRAITANEVTSAIELFGDLYKSITGDDVKNLI